MARSAQIFVVVALGSAGCLGSYSGLKTDDAGASGDGGTVDVVASFNLQVAPIMTAACVSCHKKAGPGPAFLEAAPDMLTTILAYPGVVGATPALSRLYAKGQHEGPALTPAQAQIVSDWINLYNAHKPVAGDGGVVKPQIMPFKPTMGANTVDLAMLDGTLVGQKITFTAKMIGSSLELSAITVETSASAGIHIVHPLWVIWDAHFNPSPDPIDSFSNLDETVPASQTMPLGPGTLILPSFGADEFINVVFTAVESKQIAGGGGDGGTLPGGGCKNVMAFMQFAKPTFSSTCASCHSNAGSNASQAFSLLTLNQAGGDDTACKNALGEIDTATPANSKLYTYTDPNSGITHPFKFPAKSSFADMWIVTEK